MRRSLFLAVIALFFTACSSINSIEYAKIEELHTLPQTIQPYVKDLNQSDTLYPIQQAFQEHYFKPWTTNDINTTLNSVKWPFRSYTIFNSYGSNLKPLTLNWFYEEYANANFHNYATLNQHAITLRYISLRNFPTDDPIFYNPKRAGEGFPFDYNQNSGVNPDEPVIVSHYSRDKAWVYVFTSYASGWVHSDAVAFVNKQQVQTYKDAKHLYLLRDSYPIADKQGNFICYSRIGMVLPMVGETQTDYKVLVALRDADGNAIFKNVLIAKRIASATTLTFNKANLINVGDAILHSKYGWGGIDGQRDCSSMVRDFFAPFGVWLPRNSYAQAQVGKKISLAGLTDEEKIQRIKALGIPFQTLLHQRGHILLYVGVYKGKVIVLQNIWGIGIKKGDKTGRIIIGKTVLSTLYIGKDQKYFNKNGSLIHRINSMNIITH